MSTSRKLGAAVALGILAMTVSVPSASAEPHVFELATLPDGSVGYPADINDHDVIVGRTETRAVKWYANGQIVDLGTWDADYQADARAINNNGVVVGHSDRRAVRWDARGNIDQLPGVDRFTKTCTANDINDHDVAVGVCDQRAVRWDRGARAALLPLLPGDVTSYATGVNAESLVVGFSANAAGEQHAVAWANGTVIRLGLDSAAKVNDRGWIVGSLDGHAAMMNFYHGGAVTKLDTRPSSALAINEGDVTVGYITDERGKFVPVRWEEGVTTTLPTLPGDGPYDHATGVNSSNVVVGMSAGCGVRWRG